MKTSKEPLREQEERALTYLERIKLEAAKQERSAILLRQLQFRFKDAVTPEIEARVHLGSGEALTACVDRILTESTLEGVLAPLEASEP